MAAEEPIRVFVIDDSESMRLSLKQMLSVFADFLWVGESRDGQDVLEQCEALHPDVVLMDVGLPHVDVANLTRLIREHFPLTQVIGITGFEEQSLINQMLKAGAVVCLPKHASVTLIADAIRPRRDPHKLAG
ncbi:MAG TPA: response regulator transcription factor [Aggregatilineales bacterium]|nr:response regulator transcription factor [Aggregatilineales bacterium]